VKFVSRSSSFVVVCIYRPGSQAPTSPFFDDLADLLDQMQILDARFVLCGDFNCRGDDRMSLDDRLSDVIARYNLTQHVTTSTHTDGNVLDLILTMNNEANFVLRQSVESVCFSDNHLLSCRLGIQRPPPVTITYSFRRVNDIDFDAFRADFVQSELYDRTDNATVDSFAALIDSKVTRILNVHAPMQTRSRLCGQNDSRWLSDEARQAKRLRRRLERRYQRTRRDAD
jgi:Endonuclease-reverse transcriptase